MLGEEVKLSLRNMLITLNHFNQLKDAAGPMRNTALTGNVVFADRCGDRRSVWEMDVI